MTGETEKQTAEKARKPRGPKPGAGVSGGAQPGAGRPPFVPTAEQRALVRELSGLGIPQTQIKLLVRPGGIALETLLEHFREDLDIGKAEANTKMARSLFSKGMKGDVASMIWWTKTQMRWSETQKLEVTGANGGPMQTVDLSKVSTEALLELSKAIADAAPEDHDRAPRLN